MKVQRRIIAFLLILLTVLTTMAGFTFPQKCSAASVQEIRVGLTEYYTGKEAITIKNTALGLGYCINRDYLQETVLESRTGFVIQPVFEYFVDTGIVYASYQSAKNAASAMETLGYAASPVCLYRDTWHVYLGGSESYSTMELLYSQVKQLGSYPKLQIISGNNYRMRLSGEFGSLLIDIDERYAYPQFSPTTAYKNKDYCIDLGTRVYRGRIEIGRYNKRTLTAVNIVPLEEYLYGVIPAEMPSSWHTEALKAQAICSRSYALVKAGIGGDSNAKKGYKMVDTTTSQVYKGYLAETIKTNGAVDMTQGEMVCFENKVVPAYFFSTSGGRTEASEDVWAVSLPYLKSVPDVYETNPERKPWLISLTLKELEERIQNRGSQIGAIQSLKPTKYTATGRVYALNVVGEKGNVTLQESAIRTILGLCSTKFKLVQQGDIPDRVMVKGADQTEEVRISNAYIRSAEGVSKAPATLEQYIVKGADNLANYPRSAPGNANTVVFAGMGYGHGVGMSQSGAKGMAEAGFTYKQIIAYYFTGAKVQ